MLALSFKVKSQVAFHTTLLSDWRLALLSVGGWKRYGKRGLCLLYLDSKTMVTMKSPVTGSQHPWPFGLSCSLFTLLPATGVLLLEELVSIRVATVLYLSL